METENNKLIQEEEIQDLLQSIKDAEFDITDYKAQLKALGYKGELDEEEYRKGLSTSHGWVSVKERLPEDKQEVLCFNGYSPVMSVYREVTNEHSPRFGGVGNFEVQKYPDEHDRVHSSYWAEVTHWMPLPPRPESE